MSRYGHVAFTFKCYVPDPLGVYSTLWPVISSWISTFTDLIDPTAFENRNVTPS